MKIVETNGNINIYELNNFTLSQTLDCGQAFRWQMINENLWHGAARGKYLKIGCDNGVVTLYDTSLDDFQNIWRDYFDLDRDYAGIITSISKNEILKKASSFAEGIRILNQDPWEALCSFIISQNNNIPRIKGIIERLCNSFGEKINDSFFSFPTADKIAFLTLEDLAPLRSGFRAKYILDAAKKVASGELELEPLKSINIDLARAELMKIYGVGAKVADCALLFGLGHMDAFPKDVWIKKAIKKLFDGELPKEALSYAGIVQQYIFHYARSTKLEID
ncbi:MAG: DNA-3-methyladenine glycosylase 2 family protein [Clostridia bacterium]|nr:DNA-3-methyladenine glycosylase 2 family protein [Clostridia bacterium]